MAEALLAKLKVKNPAAQAEQVQVMFKPPARHEEVVLKAQVIDKRAQKKVDRANFMATIANKKVVNKNQPVVVVAPKDPQAVEVVVSPVPVPDPKPKRKPKKLGKKLVLVEPEPGQEEPGQKKRRVAKKKSPIGVAKVAPAALVQIGKTPMDRRVKAKPDLVNIRASAYYMNNRQIFVNFINSLFAPYKKELIAASKNASCERRDGDGSSEDCTRLH